MKMNPLALTISDAVKFSGVSRTKLYGALSRGELAAIKVGNRTLIPSDAIKAWLARMPAYSPAGTAGVPK
jgi:excisionase family DNA binding protein